MIIKRLFTQNIIALLFVFFNIQPALAANTTAKNSITNAQEVALKWQPDAALVQVITFSGKADGTAEKWGYIFHSSMAKQGYRVDVKDGNIDRTLEVSASFTNPIDGDFTDSSMAMAEALKHGLVIKDKPMMMLHVMLQNTKDEGPYWNIMADRQSEEAGAIVNARTGKLYNK